jgi:hypothetical protein
MVGAGVIGASLFGARQQITILNPETILAQHQDVEGLMWLKENTLPAANVAVSSWLWLGNIWTGTDGGAWILPVTGRMSTTPPVDYIYERSLAMRINAFNEKASLVESWSEPAAAEWLVEQGVTHVYVGARGGYFDPSELSRNPKIKQAYAGDGVFVFVVE